MGISSNKYIGKVRPQLPFVQYNRSVMPISVLIIGNGFDLDLGMHTSYNDFAISKYWPYKDWTWDKGLGKYLNDKKHTEYWLDLENELANYALSLNATELCNETQVRHDKEDFNLLEKKLNEYLKAEQEKLTEDKNDTAAKLVLKSLVYNKKNYFIHSFNYTNLKIISKELNISLDEHRIEYVHGTLENGDIILGAGDNNPLPDEYDWLYKTSNKNYSPNNLADSLANADEICIFGHSLGENDFDYFKPFFQRISQHMDLTYHNPETDKRLKLTIYTKDEESEIALKRQLRKLTDNHLQGIYANCDFKIEYTMSKDKP